jgi:hypothetical protein
MPDKARSRTFFNGRGTRLLKSHVSAQRGASALESPSTVDLGSAGVSRTVKFQIQPERPVICQETRWPKRSE